MKAGELGHDDPIRAILPHLWPWLVSTNVLATVSEKRSLNVKVDLPFDDYYAYFCTYAFQYSPNVYWDGSYLPRKSRYTLSPNHILTRTLSPLCDLVVLWNLFHSIALPDLVVKSYHIDMVTTYRYGVIWDQNLTPVSWAVRDPRGPPSSSPPFPSSGPRGEGWRGPSLYKQSRFLACFRCYRRRLRSIFVTVKLWYFSRFCFDLDAIFHVLFVANYSATSFYRRVVLVPKNYRQVIWSSFDVELWRNSSVNEFRSSSMFV